MANSTASYELLQTVLDLGARLHDALEAGDTDTLVLLIERRSELLSCLKSMPRPLDPSPQWQAIAKDVMDQQRDLMRRLRTIETELSSSLNTMSRYQHARRRYTGSAQPDQQILHQHVQG